jgi:hypothetical protein
MEGNLECIKPTTCLKLNTQQCCLDARCALPCDAEVPCLISALGLTCHPMKLSPPRGMRWRGRVAAIATAGGSLNDTRAGIDNCGSGGTDLANRRRNKPVLVFATTLPTSCADDGRARGHRMA